MNPDDSWVPAFSTGVDYEAEIVSDRLKDAGIPALVMNQREKSIGIPFTDQKLIDVLVPPDRVDEARAVLEQQPISDEELERAALAAKPPDDDEDDGIEHIFPDEED